MLQARPGYQINVYQNHYRLAIPYGGAGFGRQKDHWLGFKKTMKAKDTTIAALKMAVKNRPVIQSLIFHSDRGVQYACDEFRQELKTYPLIRQSMSRKANCWDNAVAESFRSGGPF